MTSEQRTYDAVVVEDEPLARTTLRDLISEVGWLRLVGEAADGESAVELLRRARPALVFLDVQIPELSGIEVLTRLEHEPAVVFTTAYDDYAVTAFELGAVDYLMKPFGPERFHAAVLRARDRLDACEVLHTTSERATTLLNDGGYLRRVYVREGREILPIDVERIIRFEGADDYVVIHLEEARHVIGVTLADLERRLDPERFARVHRSHLVALDHVVSLTTGDDRRLTLRCTDGSEVRASRARSRALRARLSTR